MIVEAGLIKLIAAGGGLVSSIALVAGMAGGGQYAAVKADPSQLAAAACRYVGQASDPEVMRRPETAPGQGKDLGLTSEQLANAKTIISVADELRLPKRAAVIGVATALQESFLKNATVGDYGQAFGIFQQHPQHGWGTHAQVTDPRYAAKAFFSRLVKVKNWDSRPLTVVAQTVQRSAFPNAYAQHEHRAERIVSALRVTPTRPRPTPSPETSATLSPADTKIVRASLEAAIALGIKRDDVVADVAAGLQMGDLAGAGTPLDDEDSEKLAEQIVDDVATRLCQELSTQANEAIDPRVSAAADGSSRGAIALKAALKMSGIPYSWGGGGPEGPTYGIGRGARTKGFDCSGLAEYAWSKAGVQIGGHTSTQWNSGTRVPRTQLRPGDLIFFASNPKYPSTIHHVVINIDGKRYIHAPQTGSVVQIDGWTSTRESEYAGAVRPG